MSAATEPALRVRPADRSDRAVLERLWALFRHDLSAVTGELPDACGRFRRERLERALDPDEVGWGAHLALLGSSPIGFAVVRGLHDEERVLNSFFVAAAARRRGLGLAAALQVVGDQSGRWAVAFQDANTGAAGFWRRVATASCGSTWVLERLPVPGRPDLAPDSWIRFSSRSAA